MWDGEFIELGAFSHVKMGWPAEDAPAGDDLRSSLSVVIGYYRGKWGGGWLGVENRLGAYPHTHTRGPGA